MVKINDYHIPDSDIHYIEYLKNFGHYQEAQRNRAISYVEDWGFAIDIGANIGLWSMDLSKYFNKLVCFEPNPLCQEYLKKNINMKNSKVHNYALGESEESKKLILHPTNSGASSFVNRTKIDIKDDGTKIYGEFPKETPRVEVAVKKLDTFNFNKINFIKIDVQGFELNVLKGANKTLKKNNPVLCIEEDDSKNSLVIPYLEELNFELVDVINKEHIFKKK